MKKLLLAGAALTATIAMASAADAASLLYRTDLGATGGGTDYLGAAIAASAFTVTSTSGDLSSFTLADYDVVVYANQNYGIPSGDLTALNAFIASGGKVIFNDWTRSSGFNGQATYTGNNNQTSITLGPQFSSGIVSPLAVTNTSWGTFAMGLASAGGTVAATFGNGDAAIVVGNGGKTIVNGFLSDTVHSQQLYTNELASFAAGVPEPATWAMMIAGFGLVGANLRDTRRKRVTA